MTHNDISNITLIRKKGKAVTCNSENSSGFGAAGAAGDAADVLASVSLYDAHHVQSNEAKLERSCSPRTCKKQPFRSSLRFITKHSA